MLILIPFLRYTSWYASLRRSLGVASRSALFSLSKRSLLILCGISFDLPSIRKYILSPMIFADDEVLYLSSVSYAQGEIPASPYSSANMASMIS